MIIRIRKKKNFHCSIKDQMELYMHATSGLFDGAFSTSKNEYDS